MVIEQRCAEIGTQLGSSPNLHWEATTRIRLQRVENVDLPGRSKQRSMIDIGMRLTLFTPTALTMAEM
jgi:hypothetical protein